MSDHREAIAEVLIAEGAGPGNSIHSWRCEYPDRYGPCDCVGEVADALLGSDVLAQIRAEARAEALRPVLALADEWERVPNGYGRQGSTFRQAASLLRAALTAEGSA